MVDTARTLASPNPTPTSPGPTTLEGLATEAVDRLKRYARDEPVSFGLWAFGIGFVLGWRIKPW